jgi:hypothetical protein
LTISNTSVLRVVKSGTYSPTTNCSTPKMMMSLMKLSKSTVLSLMKAISTMTTFMFYLKPCQSLTHGSTSMTPMAMSVIFKQNLQQMDQLLDLTSQIHGGHAPTSRTDGHTVQLHLIQTVSSDMRPTTLDQMARNGSFMIMTTFSVIMKLLKISMRQATLPIHLMTTLTMRMNLLCSKPILLHTNGSTTTT